MKKLEDISKKEFFNVPDGYFDQLPGVIQTRIANARSERPVFVKVAFRYALPALLIGAIAWFWIKPATPSPTAEDLIAEVATEDLIAFINESDLSTDEILNTVMLDDTDADAIQGSVYELDYTEESLEIILDEIDLNSL